MRRPCSGEIGTLFQQAPVEPKLMLELRIHQVDALREARAFDADATARQHGAVLVLEQDGLEKLGAQDTALGQTLRPLGVQLSAVGGSLVEVRYMPGADALPNEYLLLGPALGIGGNGSTSVGRRGSRELFTMGLK